MRRGYTNVDLIIRTYRKDEDSCTLYLQKGYFTIEQDPISAKYADLDVDSLDAPDGGSNGEESLPWD